MRLNTSDRAVHQEGVGTSDEAAHSGTSPCTCSIVLTEGEMIDLQGMESWLLASDDYFPPDPPGRGLRLRWLKILASILAQSNAGGHDASEAR